MHLSQSLWFSFLKAIKGGGEGPKFCPQEGLQRASKKFSIIQILKDTKIWACIVWLQTATWGGGVIIPTNPLLDILLGENGQESSGRKS